MDFVIALGGLALAIGCSSSDNDDDAASRCERLRDHVIDLRFQKNLSGLDEVVEVRVPRSVYERSYKHPNIDGTGPGFCVECGDLPLITRVPR